MEEIPKYVAKVSPREAAEYSGDEALRAEIYLEPSDVKGEGYEETLEALRESNVDAVSVHAPWSSSQGRDGTIRRMFDYCQRLAEALDAIPVWHHPNLVETMYDDVLDDAETAAGPFTRSPDREPQLENQALTGFSGFVNSIMDRESAGGTLDVAHAYLGEVTDPENSRSQAEFVRDLRGIMEEYGDQIGVVHLAEASIEDNQDGEPALGEGDIPLGAVIEELERGYSGPVVVEVMPEDRKASWRNVNRFLGQKQPASSVVGVPETGSGDGPTSPAEAD